MDVLTQAQEEANRMAALLFNLIGALQRDAPPAPLKAAPRAQPQPQTQPGGAAAMDVEQHTQEMASAFMHAAKLFDTLVSALPVDEGGEAAQLKRIAELQAENEAVGQDLSQELELAEEDLQKARLLFHRVADDCLQLK